MDVLKTYKLFIGGQFPRSESGRSYAVTGAEQRFLANAPMASRKDFRNAVAAARKAQEGWAQRSGFNRGQILYRIAEMLNSRHQAFVTEMVSAGSTAGAAAGEVSAAVDALVYYAGWCDKYQAAFGTVNPTATPHFNFSVHEPMGVVAAVASGGLLAAVEVLAPVLAGGNTLVLVADEQQPLSVLSFGEVVHSSDVPAGVLNLLCGKSAELLPHLASHAEVNAMVAPTLASDMASAVAGSVKRFVSSADWNNLSPYQILACQELKTTWHPVQQSANAGGGY